MNYETGLSPRVPRKPDAADFAGAKASYAAGTGVEHVVVSQWLLTWGQPECKDFDAWLSEQDG